MLENTKNNLKWRFLKFRYFVLRFAVEGFYFNNLSLKDIICFKSVPFVYKTIKYYDKKIGETEMPLKSKIELFLQVNEYGEHVSQEHLDKIKNAYL